MCPCNTFVIILSKLECVCKHVILMRSSYQEPSVIVRPYSFVQRSKTFSVSKIQMSAALNQHPDAFHRQAWLHSHRQGGLWPHRRWCRSGRIAGRKVKLKFTLTEFHINQKTLLQEWSHIPLQKCNFHSGSTNSPPLSGSWKFGSRPFSRTFAILSTVPAWT